MSEIIRTNVAGEFVSSSIVIKIGGVSAIADADGTPVLANRTTSGTVFTLPFQAKKSAFISIKDPLIVRGGIDVNLVSASSVFLVIA